MTDEDVLAEFRAAGALLEGHFILSSGRRSGNYLQCARVLMNAERAGKLARAMVQKLPREVRQDIDLVVSPAMGGLIIGHEVGRALDRDAIFLERPEGTFELRRGFAITPGQKILMVEDVVTTGLSSRQAIEAVEKEGGVVIAEAALVEPQSPPTGSDGPPYRLPACPAAAKAMNAQKRIAATHIFIDQPRALDRDRADHCGAAMVMTMRPAVTPHWASSIAATKSSIG